MANFTIIISACFTLVALSAYAARPSKSRYSNWTSFKAKYERQYRSQIEEAERLDLLAKNKLTIDKFNEEQSKEAGYRLAMNHLTNWTHEEFKQLLGFKLPANRMPLESSSEMSETLKRILEDNSPVPEFVDWRKSGRVSSVKNQGNCGSCWAFSTVGLLEGQESPMKSINKSISLSPQNIMDCGSYSMVPCNGGYMVQALEDVANEGGVESDKDYPYLNAKGSCHYNRSLAVIVNKGSDVLPSGDEEALKKAVARYGPVSVAIEVSDEGGFRHYESGVYSDKYCSSSQFDLNHAVLVVGYGTDEEAGDYWIVKNSWSTEWGEGGYIKMARNKNNMCGIATYGVVATF